MFNSYVTNYQRVALISWTNHSFCRDWAIELGPSERWSFTTRVPKGRRLSRWTDLQTHTFLPSMIVTIEMGGESMSSLPFRHLQNWPFKVAPSSFFILCFKVTKMPNEWPLHSPVTKWCHRCLAQGQIHSHKDFGLGKGGGHVHLVSCHSRILHWRYLPYMRPMEGLYVKDIPIKYGLLWYSSSILWSWNSHWSSDFAGMKYILKSFTGSFSRHTHLKQPVLIKQFEG